MTLSLKNNMKTLQAEGNNLSEVDNQLRLIEEANITPFADKLDEIGLFPLKTKALDTLQINLGKMCNQVCEHCHVDAGPDRKEIMSQEIMLECLKMVQNSGVKIVDLTGGAPEMNPNFRFFVKELFKLKVKIIVRCNLTIIVANKKYYDLPEFFKENKVEVISSLPCYTEGNTDAQRGTGVFAKSIKALKMLNEVGYGVESSGLILHLVFNPGGISLPPDQKALEKDYKIRLAQDFGIVFNSLFTITNLPISRYLDFLVKSGRYEEYMHKLNDSFNPEAASEVMCRNTISVGWDGFLYDCDFNQMLDLKVDTKSQLDKLKAGGKHISDYVNEELNEREILVNQHCYGCTAGSGSGCGGSLL